jgi:hypothetical protein
MGKTKGMVGWMPSAGCIGFLDTLGKQLYSLTIHHKGVFLGKE